MSAPFLSSQDLSSTDERHTVLRQAVRAVSRLPGGAMMRVAQRVSPSKTCRSALLAISSSQSHRARNRAFPSGERSHEGAGRWHGAPSIAFG